MSNGGATSRVLGTPWLRFLLIVLAIGTYVVLWAVVYRRIWNAGNGAPPTISNSITYVIGAVGGALAAAFAAALGIERQDTARDPRVMAFGVTLVGGNPDKRLRGFSVSATLAVWAYALVSVIGVVTIFFHTDQSPSDVKTAIFAFIAAVVYLFVGSLTPGNTEPPSTPPPAA